VLTRGLKKFYELEGERVSALRGIDLHPTCEFLPIREGEFVMVRRGDVPVLACMRA
jgi:hypothetical protein